MREAQAPKRKRPASVAGVPAELDDAAVGIDTAVMAASIGATDPTLATGKPPSRRGGGRRSRQRRTLPAEWLEPAAGQADTSGAISRQGSSGRSRSQSIDEGSPA